MNRLHPTRESVKCARVEALIQCQRCQEALDACKTLLPLSVDAAYLTAEALWRLGRLDDAAAALRGADCHSRSIKCAELLDFVTTVKVRRLNYIVCQGKTAIDLPNHQHTLEAVECIEAGDDAVVQLNQLLACKRVAGTCMHAELLRHRAALVTDHRSAIADLETALRIDPENVRCLALRAGLYDLCGDAERCFLDLRRVEMLAPQQVRRLRRQILTQHLKLAHSREEDIPRPSCARPPSVRSGIASGAPLLHPMPPLGAQRGRRPAATRCLASRCRQRRGRSPTRTACWLASGIPTSGPQLQRSSRLPRSASGSCAKRMTRSETRLQGSALTRPGRAASNATCVTRARARERGAPLKGHS
jgi:hypothetical protein